MMRTQWIAAALLGACVVLIPQAHYGLADHNDGNVPPGSFVNYYVVQDGHLQICNNSASIVTTTKFADALAIWNDGIGGTIVTDAGACSTWGIRIIDVDDEICPHLPGQDPIACAPIPNSDAPQQLEIWMEGDIDPDHVISALAHEIGHTLGFCHVPACNSTAYTATSIMSPRVCCPTFTQLQQLDKDNYHRAYHVDAPAGVSATTSSGGNVTLSWDGSNLHNESGFYFIRQDGCGGPWSDPIGAVGKNETSVPLPNQPGGLHNYQVVSATAAPGEIGEASSTYSINVQGVLSPPSSLSSSFLSGSYSRTGWAPVGGAAYYKVRTDFSASGSFCSFSAPIYATELDSPLPQLDAVQWYNRVVACTANDLCSRLSGTFTQTQYVDAGGWNYAFTVYRSGGDIALQFVNLMSNQYGFFSLGLHVTNGTSLPPSPALTIDGKYPTDCIPYNGVSPIFLYDPNQFSSAIIGTFGHTAALMSSAYAPITCSSDHSGDGTSYFRWASVPS